MEKTKTYDEAVKHFGSMAALARAVGINKSSVLRWGGRIPIAWAATVEKALGRQFNGFAQRVLKEHEE